MTLNCNNINLKKGSKGTQVKELQEILQKKGYYNGIIDGDYGTLTEQAVKQLQTMQGNTPDGWFGKKTCTRLNQNNNTPSNTTTNTAKTTTEYTTFTNTKLCTTKGGDCLGQITGYHCAPHSIKQSLRRFNITKYTEKQIGQYAGTTTKGTGHQGIETAIQKIAQNENIQLKTEWKNLTDLGNTTKEQFHKIGDLMTDTDKAVILHVNYRNQYGHYEVLQKVDTKNNTIIVANSLGSKCNPPAYCGYMEDRNFSTMKQYIMGISQKSVCIITKK